MASYLSWGANAALIATGCFVTANMANGIIAEWVAPPMLAAAVSAPEASSEEPARRNPRVIVEKNLFASPDEPIGGAAEVTEQEGPLEATTLPLRLLGTVASPNPDLARGALEDTASGERLVVEVGDRIMEKATVLRIEQRRVVLAENAGLRELSLDDDREPSRPPSVQRASNDRSRRRAANRPRRAARERATPSIQRDEVQETLRDPSKLFQQARFVPKYDEGEMQGLQVSAIKSGSILEDIGLGEGDVITEANGRPMNSPTSSGALFRELNDATELVISVTRADGSSDEIEVPIDE